MKVSETEIIVRYCETDQMGIVHHSNYPVWFEVGRTDFLRKLGLKYSDMEKQGVMLPVVSLNCKFINPARYEDVIIVRTRLGEVGCVRLTFDYEIMLKDGLNPIVLGETTHAWTDRNLKPLSIKKKMPGLYAFLKSLEHENK
ncbi:MAG: acyl-CoA thioesterase [Clostridiaceae bacterium]|nr:acyl-CoA thioesterase [Clostridiaceae bacterium]